MNAPARFSSGSETARSNPEPPESTLSTRLRAAGAAAGALAGGVGAAIYALHCYEMTLPFVAVWYVLGIAIPAARGALLGPRWLRWS